MNTSTDHSLRNNRQQIRKQSKNQLTSRIAECYHLRARIVCDRAVFDARRVPVTASDAAHHDMFTGRRASRPGCGTGGPFTAARVSGSVSDEPRPIGALVTRRRLAREWREEEWS